MIEDFARIDQVERQFLDGILDRIAGHDEIMARQDLLAFRQLELVEQQRRCGTRGTTGDTDGMGSCDSFPTEKEPVDRPCNSPTSRKGCSA
jgi:hypothetical protein